MGCYLQSIWRTNNDKFHVQLYNFRKRQLPAEDDEEGMSVLASKLAKYNVSIPEYMAAIRDVDVPW